MMAYLPVWTSVSVSARPRCVLGTLDGMNEAYTSMLLLRMRTSFICVLYWGGELKIKRIQPGQARPRCIYMYV